jgi:hypothetical protein
MASEHSLPEAPSSELTLYGFMAGDEIGIEDLSPLVTKVHTYLKMRKWPYKFVSQQVSDAMPVRVGCSCGVSLS